MNWIIEGENSVRFRFKCRMLADLLIGLLEVAMDSLARRKLTKVEKAASQLGLLEPLYSVRV